MPTILITGANKGLGLGFATRFAGEGWTVLASCRNPAEATALKALADELGLAQPAIAVRVRAHAASRRLLGEGGTGRGGKHQGREATGQKGLFHLDNLIVCFYPFFNIIH